MPVHLRTMLLGSLIIVIMLVGACTHAVVNQPIVLPSTEPVPTAEPTSPTATAEPTERIEPTSTPLPPTPMPSPTSTPLPITGERGLARGASTERLRAIMFDNHPAAYPQTGLDKAALVFEAPTEYGITRYMGIFAPGISPDAATIGAVRSARLYFVQWAIGLGAVFVHAGGSPDGLNLAQSASEIINMDALRDDASAYFSRSEDREAPHNLYTSSAEIARFLADKDPGTFDPSGYGFLFKPDQPADQRPDAQRLDYYFIHADDPAGWIYDAESNGYYRLRRNKPHIDGQTGEQLWFKNVAIMETDLLLIPGDDAGRIDLNILGEGRARTFVDGIEHEVRWSKPSPAAPLHFYTLTGEEVTFNAGPVWIAAIPSLDHLTVE